MREENLVPTHTHRDREKDLLYLVRLVVFSPRDQTLNTSTGRMQNVFNAMPLLVSQIVKTKMKSNYVGA